MSEIARALAFLWVIAAIVAAGCAPAFKPADDEARFGPSAPKQRILDAAQYRAHLDQGKVSFPDEVKPILDSRCVVCHACYDAPCQLKLDAFEGVDRGATKKTVYNGRRLAADEPTRLFTDATTTAAWRGKGFFPVLNERGDTDLANLNNALLFRMLELKRDHPLPRGGRLPEAFEFALNRPLECPTAGEFDDFRRDHPLWGMPYALPAVSGRERDTLVQWLREGAKAPAPPPLSPRARDSVERWEVFLNGQDNKKRLVARYIYEHLFLGHIRFEGHPPGEFYQLVRSKTGPGLPVHEIATVRPYDDPGAGAFYYRLRPVVSTIVDKTHFVYELSDRRMRRYEVLFLQPDWDVAELPSYALESASNPFKTFAAIPSRSRFKFLLDDAAYFVAGFIKGPVCRGQIALNVIRDRFWIVFFDPDLKFLEEAAAFLAKNSQLLSLPAGEGDAPGLTSWMAYDDLQRRYLEQKEAFIDTVLPVDQGATLDMIWDGDGHNRNAALTVFRHFDSASVVEGFVGDSPLTGWVISYPVFERIHYLLVAGFNVYGSVGHQLATRLYMDFLRMEAENDLLRFMPSKHRTAMHAAWNAGVGGRIKSFFDNPLFGLKRETGVVFSGDDPKKEFFMRLRGRFGAAAGPEDTINRCEMQPCPRPGTSPDQQDADEWMRAVTRLRGAPVQALPEASFLRIRHGGESAEDSVYTLLRNEALRNVSFIFAENLRREPEKDTITVVPGLVGSYPNFFFDVEMDRLPEFVGLLSGARSKEDFDVLYETFGVRRSHPEFWHYSDWFNERNRQEHPIEGGLFDLNRYDNL